MRNFLYILTNKTQKLLFQIQPKLKKFLNLKTIDFKLYFYLILEKNPNQRPLDSNPNAIFIYEIQNSESE